MNTNDNDLMVDALDRAVSQIQDEIIDTTREIQSEIECANKDAFDNIEVYANKIIELVALRNRMVELQLRKIVEAGDNNLLES